MNEEKARKRIAILGAGPSGLFMYKRLVEANRSDWEIDIFDKNSQLGAGMPYSQEGANEEHVTNVSSNEVPDLVTSLEEWLQTLPQAMLDRYGIDPQKFTEYKVVPRLLFGNYLAAQFDLLLEQANKLGISTRVHFSSAITDITDQPDHQQVVVTVNGRDVFAFDQVILCTGHHWPKKHEGTVRNYFDSPYPPAKLILPLNHTVAIRGSSLTAIDAIRTLARNNGTFITQPDGKLSFQADTSSPDFKLVIHSRGGFLPTIRFHLEESLLSKDALLTTEEIAAERARNDGFLPLDYVFEKNFKEVLRSKDPGLYEQIKAMRLEEFVDMMMDPRERLEAFELFKIEYREAQQSIQRQESISWKELLAELSYTMNYPAKYFSAEDMLRLQKVLMPLIAIVIAFVPQRSAQELLALHQADRLSIISVGSDSEVEPEKNGGATVRYTSEDNQLQVMYYQTFVDCIGQPHLPFEDFPFKSLIDARSVSPARLRFRSAQEGEMERIADTNRVEQGLTGDFYLKVPGLAINDHFQVVDANQVANPRIYMMAVPYMGGYNPDYSGLDFCDTASERILNRLLELQDCAELMDHKFDIPETT
ncbi:FAD/NAD(P)-binding protein [Larkinella terrae]|uniref:FAD-dependent urate hydroxylase HpyO/Asp monooxygenase CreE-like FAD/NAD(P)-binding domain-containing protein n=1 Tax=Larkinella terrae TaxID=2025311 RepID=A0A7K0EMH5_9BACT|nr:FAD/NAD(P)-binding protein [Larkinella terrae]MRS63014.1 hypothetical protein [Larkinella terrae]